MLPAFEKLSKMLKLEQQKEYQNQAVLGGLEKYADHWQEEALAATLSESQIADVVKTADLLKSYPDLGPEQRAETVHHVLTWLEDMARLSTPPLRKPAPQKPTPTSTSPAPSTPQPPDLTPKTTTMPQSPAPDRTSKASVPQATGLDAPVTVLPAISTAYAARLEKLGIFTVEDLLYHFPHRYDDYRTLKPINRLEYGEETTIIGTIWETSSRRTGKGGTIVSSIIADASGTIEAIWFNQPYLARQLRPGRQIVLSGKVDEWLGRLTLQSPAWEPLERDLIHTGRLVPIYPLTSGITARWMRQRTKRILDHWAPRLQDPLPEAIRERLGLMNLSTAIQQIHFPKDQQTADRARHRLAFDEFLMIQLGLLRQREIWQSQQGTPLRRNQPLLEAFLESLPFKLTEAQQRSLDHILTDLEQARPMSRLLQGDVGSGKTIVAAAAMVMAAAAGKQTALMAPTEILAEQHAKTISQLLAPAAKKWGLGRPISVALLTGSLRRVERRQVYTALASGEADMVIGTHALIQRHVTFKDLGLVIVDEQHRFGVVQRAALRSKGLTPHTLVMSATPIPRSLALTIYGDLDISVIDELPPGRQPIETRWLLPRERERTYQFLRGQIQRGRQVFILYPLVGESEKVEAKAAVEEHERLQIIFPDLRLGLLHGRMKGKEKEEVMTSFHKGEIDILVSTSVIEVGIDVPNATVMLIEGADRFGLAQLHQFRGRVGRGEHKSYCLLISDNVSPDDEGTKATWERLKAIEETEDGFVLAEKDLELRGPGDFLGVRQSGLPTLRLASLTNVRTLEQARTEAQAIFRDDPSLSKPEHRKLAAQVARFWKESGEPS